MNQRRRLAAFSESMEARLVLSAVTFAPDSGSPLGDSVDATDNPNQDDQSTDRDVDDDAEVVQKRTSQRRRATGTRNDGRSAGDQAPVTDSKSDSNRGSGTYTGDNTETDSDSSSPNRPADDVVNDDSSRTDTTDSRSTDDTSDQPASDTVSKSKDSDSTTTASDSTRTRVDNEPTDEAPPTTQTAPTATNEPSSDSREDADPIVIRKQETSAETDRNAADSPDGTRTRKIETQPTDQTESEPDTESKPRTATPTRSEPRTETPQESTPDSDQSDSTNDAKSDESPAVKDERSVTVIRKTDPQVSEVEVKQREEGQRDVAVLRTSASVVVVADRDKLDSERTTVEEPIEVQKPTTESRDDIAATSEKSDDLEEPTDASVTDGEPTAELPPESGPASEPGPVDHPQHVPPDLHMPSDQHVDRMQVPVLDSTQAESVATKYVQFLQESRTSVNLVSLLEDDLNGTVISQESVVAQNLFGDATRLGLMLAALNHSGRRSGALISFSDSDEQVRDEGTHYSKERRRRRTGLSRRAPTAFDRLRLAFSLSESVDERAAIPCAVPSCDALFADAATMSVLFHEMDDDSGSAVGSGTLFGGLLAATTGIALSRASQSRKNRQRNRPVAATPRYNGETLVFAD